MERRWQASLVELIKRTACDLPRDVERALRRACDSETDVRSADILSTLLDNVRLARMGGIPMCQDTGTPTFRVRLPRQADTEGFEALARRAISAATKQGFLRRNTIDVLDNRSLDDNIGEGTPVFDYLPPRGDIHEVSLLLKGGGCENVAAQYSLPQESLNAGRDLAGVRRCVLDAVWRAQGAGCAPGIIGLCIGGDRAQGFHAAKMTLFRPIGRRAPDSRLAEFEVELLESINRLGIGPMGMGGRTTVLDVKATTRARLPASYFVTVAYMCWACRRRGFRIAPNGEVLRWIG